MDGWQITAAIATSVSALVIAWQAFETRRSAAASNKAVRIAEESLNVARKEGDRSTALVAESVKARLDVGAPSLSFRKDSSAGEENEFVQWDPRQPESEMQPFHLGFHVPQHNERMVWLKPKVIAENHGALPVTLHSSQPVFHVLSTGQWENPRQAVGLPSGAKVRCGVLIGGTLSSWVTASKQAGMENGYRPTFQFVSEVNSNSGVVNIQRIEIQGRVARELSEGQWSLNGTPHVSLLPLQKVYVLDSSKGLEIPDAPAALYPD